MTPPADTIAAVDLIAPMTTLYPQVGHITLEGLMDWQRHAYGTWRRIVQPLARRARSGTGA